MSDIENTVDLTQMLKKRGTPHIHSFKGTRVKDTAVFSDALFEKEWVLKENGKFVKELRIKLIPSI